MAELCLVFRSVVGNEFVLISTEAPPVENSWWTNSQVMMSSGDDVIRFITKSWTTRLPESRHITCAELLMF